MSIGCTPTFCFATQQPNIFKEFYTFSALPELNIEAIDFKNLSQGKPIYSILAIDDDVFAYDDVFSIYNAHKKEASNWHFESIEDGGHCFIDDPGLGNDIFHKLFRCL